MAMLSSPPPAAPLPSPAGPSPAPSPHKRPLFPGSERVKTPPPHITIGGKVSGMLSSPPITSPARPSLSPPPPAAPSTAPRFMAPPSLAPQSVAQSSLAPPQEPPSLLDGEVKSSEGNMTELEKKLNIELEIVSSSKRKQRQLMEAFMEQLAAPVNLSKKKNTHGGFHGGL